MAVEVMKMVDFDINYSTKEVTVRFDKPVAITNLTSVFTFVCNDQYFNSTDNTPTVVATAIRNSASFSSSGYDITLKFSTSEKVNCSRSVFQLVDKENRFTTNGVGAMFDADIIIDRTNFLDPDIAAWQTIGEYSNYVYRILLIISLLIISKVLDTYLIILSYIYMVKLNNVVFPPHFNALLTGFLKDLNWPLSDYTRYFTPDSNCVTLPLKLKSKLFDCQAMRNSQFFLLIITYLCLVKTILMLFRFCMRKGRGKLAETVAFLDNRLNKDYFIRIISANIMFFTFFCTLGIYNDSVVGISLTYQTFITNLLIGLAAVGFLLLLFAMIRKTIATMFSTDEAKPEQFQHLLFLKMIGLEYNLDKFSYFFFLARHLKLFVIGVLTYPLYDFPYVQVCLLLVLEIVYIALLFLKKPYNSRLKMIEEYCIHLLIILIQLFMVLIVPVFNIVSYNTFQYLGKTMAVFQFMLICYVCILIFVETFLIIKNARKRWKELTPDTPKTKKEEAKQPESTPIVTQTKTTMTMRAPRRSPRGRKSSRGWSLWRARCCRLRKRSRKG